MRQPLRLQRRERSALGRHLCLVAKLTNLFITQYVDIQHIGLALRKNRICKTELRVRLYGGNGIQRYGLAIRIHEKSSNGAVSSRVHGGRTDAA